MGMRGIASAVAGSIGKNRFQDRTRFEFTRWLFIAMIIVGPPAAVAAPAVVVTGNQILLGQIG
jgi:hypothetical protein